MNPSADPLQVEPLHFPLQGSRVIEASAGTGKTWTIAALYLRLVLGHGAVGMPARLPADILVLTFTDAASQELRDRIRSRLAQAARYFYQGFQESAGPPVEADAFLQSLRADHDPEQWPACARVLDLAAQSMDEASIGTIHAWCARMLQEHAFDSGSLFDHQVEPDLADIEQEAVWDYWRTFVAPLDLDSAAVLRGWWRGPDALHRAVGGALHDRDLPPSTNVPLVELLRQAEQARQQRLAELKAPWQQGVQELAVWLESLGKDWSVAARYWRRWVGDLQAWAMDPDAEELALKTGWERLSPAGIVDKWVGTGPAPTHPLCETLAHLQGALDALPDGRKPVMDHALAWIAARLQAALDRQARLGFDGLLTHLAAALEGPGGEPLARVLRKQYPAILIDEFQDTDPVQYQIFDRIYRIAQNDPDLCLIMIGDPKQAIYGFRGADIHAYLHARRACEGRVYTLDQNFRSSQAMVGAVNAWFEQAAATAGRGVFPVPGEPEGIVFTPVRAQGRPEQWWLDGQDSPALSIHWIESSEAGKPLAIGVHDVQASLWCAQHVARLLALARQGAAGFMDEGRLRPVQPADIAVLVNSHAEARQVREALSRQQVRSVYLSERESVYDTPQAGEISHWLAACARPEDGRLLRTALATRTLDLNWVELEALSRDERSWEDMVGRFQRYHECWRRRGVLPMIRRLLNDFGVSARLLAGGHDGERALTDILHLAELLQQASARLDGEQALMRHLSEQREGSAVAGGEDARRVRLESDENLVRVVTVHKSKGLEYPLVFLPFAAKAHRVKGDRGPYYLHEAGGRRRVFRPTAADVARLDEERLAEDVRKLYVALTRARHAVWMAMGPLRGLEDQSAVGHLLGAAPGQAYEALAALVAAHPQIVFDPALTRSMHGHGDEAVDPPLGAARHLQRSARGPAWWISSYSALRVDAQAPVLAAQTAQEDIRQEVRHLETPALPGQTPIAATQPAQRAVSVAFSPTGAAHEPHPGALHDFPRGSEAGTFLHGLLEWAGRRDFASLNGTELRDLLVRRCATKGWSAWVDPLYEWLLSYVSTPLTLDLPQTPPLRLDQLPAILPEMEFWLPVHHVDVLQLDALITAATLQSVPRPPVQAMTLGGMFKGFIDLALQHGGRYYVIDYKSNWLGPDASAYHPQAMQETMAGARYDLQYVLYVLALHRQLAARLPDYDYDQHMGGAVYLFLRGLDAPGQGVFVDRPARHLIEQLDALFAGGKGA